MLNEYPERPVLSFKIQNSSFKVSLMILFLRVFFIVVLVSMLGVTGWASSEVALWKTPSEVATHPWFIATLFDAYWGFLTFFCWVAYKETSWLARSLWLLFILLFGNIAMAIYMLIQLYRVPTDASLEQVLLRRRS
jgi:predicted permease